MLVINVERSPASDRASNPSIQMNKKPKAHAATAASRAPVRSIVMSTSGREPPPPEQRELGRNVHLWTKTPLPEQRVGSLTLLGRAAAAAGRARSLDP